MVCRTLNRKLACGWCHGPCALGDVARRTRPRLRRPSFRSTSTVGAPCAEKRQIAPTTLTRGGVDDTTRSPTRDRKLRLGGHRTAAAGPDRNEVCRRAPRLRRASLAASLPGVCKFENSCLRMRRGVHRALVSVLTLPFQVGGRRL
jgi:hypothetical protein